MKCWQDRVMVIVGFLFGAMLIPSLIDSLNGHPINIITSLLTTIGVYTIAVCMWTLKLKLTFIGNIITGTTWLMLFILGVIK